MFRNTEGPYYPDLHSEPKQVHGIYVARPTGNVLDDNPQYIEVIMGHNIVRYARPCYAFGHVAAPSKEWLEKYKAQILILITYAGGDTRYPFWLGYTFVDGKTAEDFKDFPNEAGFRFEKFIERFNDKENTWSVEQVNDLGINQRLSIKENKTFIESKDIHLGSEDAKEPALLGKTTVDLLSDLIDAIIAITVGTGMGPSSTPINAAQFQALKLKLETLKSKVVNLD